MFRKVNQGGDGRLHFWNPASAAAHHSAARPSPVAHPLAAVEPIGVESHSTGAPQRNTPRRILPAPVLSSLRPLVRNGLASQFDRYARLGKVVIQILRRLDRFCVEIAPAHKGFLPPATRGLGCAVQMEIPASTGSPCQGSITDARAAISV